jgi:iron complex outermembrane recepter protein
MKSILIATLFLVTTVSFAQETPTKTQDSIAKVEKTNNLQEVSIYGNKKQFVKVEADKTTVNVKDNAMLSTGTAYEAVRKLPGVITSPTGSLVLNGKSVKIYIDGSPSTLTGNDLENYLSSLPANAIEKVELVYNPGASYDANSSGSVINIITSSKRLKGVNASLNLNYNFNKYQKPSPQILLNGKEKSFSWQTMLGYNYIDSDEKSRSNQIFTSFAPTKSINQESFKKDTERNLYFRVGTNFKISPKSNLLFNYNVNSANDRSQYNSFSNGDIADYTSSGVSKTKNINHEISLQYKTKLDTLGRTLDIVSFTNFFDKNPINNSTASGNSAFNSNIDFGLLNYYLKYDFALPIGKKNFVINTGGKYNTLKVKNNGHYFANSVFPSSVNFDYIENNLAFYVEASKKIKKLSLVAGLRFEDYKVERVASTITDKINYNNSNFFPTLSATYEIAENINAFANYSKKIEQPSYNNLDPNNSANFNQYSSSTGNINLKPTFFDNYEFRISAFDFVQLGANYTLGKDDSRFIFNAKPGQLVSNQTTQGFDKIKTFSAYFSFPLPLDYFLKSKEEFKKRMNTIDKMNYIFFNIAYVKSTIDGFSFPFENKPIINYYAQSQIMLPWDITNNITYFILPPGVWEIYKIEKPIQQFDISFNKNFMNKKLKVSLHAFDLFNINEVNALVAGDNLNTVFYQKKDSQSFRVSLTYNFGNLKLENENTKIETEKAKAGGGMMK